MSEASDASKLEIEEITEKIADISVKILEKVEKINSASEFASPLDDSSSSCVSITETFNDAVEKMNSLKLEESAANLNPEEKKKDLLLKKLEMLQKGKATATRSSQPQTSVKNQSIREEIEKIREQIQTKIAKEIIPKLESIKHNYKNLQQNPKNYDSNDDKDDMSMSSDALEDEVSSLTSSSSSMESVLENANPDCLISSGKCLNNLIYNPN